MIIKSIEHVPSDVLTVATDASSNGRMGVIAWVNDAGVWWAHRAPSNLSPTLLELVAVAAAVRHNVGRIHIQCDNANVLRLIQKWTSDEPRYLQPSLRGPGLSLEKQQVKAIARTLARRLTYERHDITFEKVKSHEGEHLNNAADALARSVLNLPSGTNKKKRTGRYLAVAQRVEPFIGAYRYKTDRLRGSQQQVIYQ